MEGRQALGVLRRPVACMRLLDGRQRRTRRRRRMRRAGIRVRCLRRRDGRRVRLREGRRRRTTVYRRGRGVRGRWCGRWCRRMRSRRVRRSSAIHGEGRRAMRSRLCRSYGEAGRGSDVTCAAANYWSLRSVKQATSRRQAHRAGQRGRTRVRALHRA